MFSSVRFQLEECTVYTILRCVASGRYRGCQQWPPASSDHEELRGAHQGVGRTSGRQPEAKLRSRHGPPRRMENSQHWAHVAGPAAGRQDPPDEGLPDVHAQRHTPHVKHQLRTSASASPLLCTQVGLSIITHYSGELGEFYFLTYNIMLTFYKSCLNSNLIDFKAQIV